MKWLYRRKNWPYTTDLYLAAAKEALDKFGPASTVFYRRLMTIKRYYPETGRVKRFIIDQAVPFGISFAWSLFVVNNTYDQIGVWAALLAIISGSPIVVTYGLFLAPWLKGWA